MVPAASLRQIFIVRPGGNDLCWRALSSSSVDCTTTGSKAFVRASVDRVCIPIGSNQLSARPTLAYRGLRGRVPLPVLLAAGVRICLRLVVGVLELLGGCQMALHFSYVSTLEDF
jgi:hypothetical protein